MFGTLLGGLPPPPADAGDPLDAVLRAQEAAGLEPLTDGRLGDGALDAIAARLDGVQRMPDATLRLAGLPRRTQSLALEAWRRAASRTSSAVKQALPGPYSLLRRLEIGDQAPEAVIEALAEALREEVMALAAEGCPMVEIEESASHQIGDDAAERARFRAAHTRLAEGPAGTHLSLSIIGGSAAGAGTDTILAAPYASLAVDLIAGPDNWYLVSAAPGDRGIVAGVIDPRQGSDDGPEAPVWAAHYAASTGGRGLQRIGLAVAGSLAALPWAAAEQKLQRLGNAARIAGLPRDDKMAALDPRALDLRSAALGRVATPPPRRARQER